MDKMNTKLTLKLDKRAIDRAKKYARKHRQSLSAMVENYFNTVTKEEDTGEIEISPNVLELSGIIKLSGDVDLKEIYRKHLEEKYSG